MPKNFEVKNKVDKEQTAEIAAAVTITNPPSEQTSGVGNTPVPNATVPDPVLAPKEVENTTVKSHTDNPTISFPLQESLNEKTVPLTKKLESWLEVGFTPHFNRSYFMSKKVHLKDFDSPDTFIDAKREKALELLPMYWRMPYDLDSMLNPVDDRLEKVTTEECGGFPVYSTLKKLNRTETRETNGIYDLASLNIQGPESRVFERHLYYAEPCEAELLRQFETIYMRYAKRPQEIRRIFRNMDTDESFVLPLDGDANDPDFNFIMFIPMTPAYRILLDRTDAFRQIMIEAHHSLLEQHVPTKIESSTLTVDELFKTYRIEESVRDFTSDIARSVSSAAAKQFFMALLTGCLMNRWCGLDYKVNFDGDPNAVIIAECVMLKLLVPYNVMHGESALDIDNYLAMHMIQALPGYRPAQWSPPSPSECKNGTINYLTQALTTANVISNQAVISSFLLTGGDGSGWNTTENFDPVMLDPSMNEFVSERTIQYVPLGGRETDRETDFAQFIRFKHMMDVISVDRWPRNVNGRHVSYAVRMLDVEVKKVSRAQDMIWYANRILSRMGLMASVYPMSPDLTLDENQKPNINCERRIRLMQGGPMSVLFLVDFSHTDHTLITPDFIKTGWCINNYFTNLVEVTQYVRSSYTHKKFTKSMKVDIINKTMTANFSLHPVIMEKVGAFPRLYDLMKTDIPDRGELDLSQGKFSQSIAILHEFIERNLIRFGVVDHFFLDTRRGERRKKDIAFFSHHWQQEFDDEEIMRTLTYEDVRELFLTEEYTPLIQRAKNEGGVIRFNIPIKLNPIEMTKPGIDHDLPEPISFHFSGKVLTINKLDIYYYWKDNFEWTRSIDLAYSREPLWVSDSMYPFIWRDELDYQHIVSNVFDFRKKGITIWEKFQYARAYN